MTAARGVCVIGAGGRLGRRVIRLLSERDDLKLASALDRADTDAVGTDAGELAGVGSLGLKVTAVADEAIAAAKVAIEFSAPPASKTIAPLCAEHGVAYILASTALGADDEAAVAKAAEVVPVLQAANFSVGVAVMLELAEEAARRLGDTVDIEMNEIHHKVKKDAPSGTALALAAAVHRGRSGLKNVLGRSGAGARQPAELGIAALRGGDVAGEHTVYFLGDDERIEITHRATSPDIFARGALRAAAWLVEQPPGRYTMREMLGIK